MEYLILILSLAGIVLGADFLVKGAVVVARKCRVSSFVIGAVIVGIGTSLPELVVSTVGAIGGNSEVAIGNVVGSNIFNVFAILGLTALFFPIAVSRENMKFEIPFCIAVSVLLMLLVYNFFVGGEPRLGRWDGAALFLVFTSFMWISLRRGKSSAATVGESVEEVNKSLWFAAFSILGGLAALIVSSNFFVDEAVAIARKLGVSDAFISITLLACGTSLPELAASVTAAVKKDTDMALGNIIGSNIFNATMILGTASLITPLTTGKIGLVDYGAMILAAVLPMIFGIRGKITRFEGLLMLLCYAAYTWYIVTYVMAV
ncbi:MAG: calcium/sodium antiporter [Candidatus Cryptobacteroides sp.]|nr:calcium/sodium antiporter [Bacteroidales bacterium]MDY2773021.1 calcium/sodium antiporter [Candidatus Cryptobacteroides sp.]